MVSAGLVRHFDLFEISEVRAESGRALATRKGVSDRVAFHTCDAFEQDLGQYDLVYWNNALHHMLDADSAVRWSRERLKLGGSFVMDDYVGPNRHQWTDVELDVAQGVRLMLPPQYRRDPQAPERELPLRPLRKSVEEMVRRDPTEAPDSENILPSVSRHFPNAEIIPTGGVIYHLALNEVIANFDETRDVGLLEALLAMDRALTDVGLSHYAVAFHHDFARST